MKTLFLLITCLITIVGKAQFGSMMKALSKGAGSNANIVSVNLDQIIGKVGEAKLMQMIDLAANNKSESKDNTQKKAKQKRAIAAIYGAGIDFSKKMWVVPNTLISTDDKYSKGNTANIIPIKNKQVIIENILLLSDGEVALIKNEKDGITYLHSPNSYKQQVIIITENEMIVCNLPVNNFNNFNDYGRIISIDTIKNETYNNVDLKEEKQIAKKDVKVIEIDKWENGKIKRIYKKASEKKVEMIEYKPPVFSNDTALNYADSPIPAIDDPNAIVSEAAKEAVRVAYDTLSTISGAPIQTDFIKDTLTRYDYVNGKSITIKYIPYTEDERRNAEKEKEQLQKADKEKSINELIGNYSKLFIFNNPKNADVQYAIDAKDDLVMITTIPIITSMNLLKYYVIGSTNSSIEKEKEEFSFLQTINFENGKVASTYQVGCCSNYTKQVNNIYNPITSFMPNQLLGNNYGSMRYNLNIPNFINYIKAIIPTDANVENKFKDQDMQLSDFENLFTGEIALTIGTERNLKKEGSVNPSVAIALKLKDAKLAVAKMNIIASQQLKMTSNYRFAENGEYLIFSSSNQFLNKKTNLINAKPLQLGHFGEMNVDIKGMLKAVINKRDMKSFGTLLEMIGKMNVISNKTEDGKFVTNMTMEIGSANTNALVTYVDMMKKMTEVLLTETKSVSKPSKFRIPSDEPKTIRRTTTKKVMTKKKK